MLATSTLISIYWCYEVWQVMDLHIICNSWIPYHEFYL